MAGSRKGVPNKFTASMKEAFREAFDNAGGVGSLTDWARENPTDFYKLAARMIPTEVEAKVDSNVTVEVVSFKKPAAKKRVTKKPAAKKRTAKKPAAKKRATKKPAARKRVTKKRG